MNVKKGYDPVGEARGEDAVTQVKQVRDLAMRDLKNAKAAVLHRVTGERCANVIKAFREELAALEAEFRETGEERGEAGVDF